MIFAIFAFEEEGMIERLASFAMGTRFELVLAGDDPGRLRPVGEAALAEIDDLDRRWSLFRRDSLLSFINRHAAERPVRVDQDTFEVLSIAEQVRRESGGLFDVAVAPAMRRLGFHPDAPKGPATVARGEGTQGGRTPGSLTRDLRPEGASEGLVLGEDHTVRLSSPHGAIDLGGIAKGYAVDAALRILREHAVGCALIHGGTSCVGALGAPPGRDAWMISIACEGDPPVVPLRDSCLAVSSPAGREIEAEGRRIGHIIDPRIGQPAACARVACVIGPSATMCDAWAKPAIIARSRPPSLPPGFTTLIDAGDTIRPEWAAEGPAAHDLRIPLPCTP